MALSGQVKTGHTWSLQNRPYGPGLRCCTLPFAFLTSLISEISRWRDISSSKLEKIPFTGPWGHFLKVSHSSGCGFLATFRRGAHCSAGNLVLQLRGPHLRIWPWWRRRSSIAVTAALSPSSFPQSSTGRFNAESILMRSPDPDPAMFNQVEGFSLRITGVAFSMVIN